MVKYPLNLPYLIPSKNNFSMSPYILLYVKVTYPVLYKLLKPKSIVKAIRSSRTIGQFVKPCFLSLLQPSVRTKGYNQLTLQSCLLIPRMR